MTKIEGFRYRFESDEIDRISSDIGNLLTSQDFLSCGSHVAEFEKRFADWVGLRHAVAVSNGTSGLQAVFESIGVSGREVIVPTNTFAATAFAVIRAGGQPVFADCGDDLCVDVEDVERRITGQTGAIVVVHIGGVISKHIRRLQTLCNDRDIPLIEDAAHAHGSTLAGAHSGAFGTAAVYSFFTTKVMTTGEGGMVVTRDPELAERVRLLCDQAKIAGTNRHEIVGMNARMSEFHAIVGLSQLRTIDSAISDRDNVAAAYDDQISESPRIRRLDVDTLFRSNHYKYTLILNKPNAAEVAGRLRSNYDIVPAGRVYDVPCHLQPVFNRHSRSSLPRAELLCQSHICLPIHHELSVGDVKYVAQSLLEVLG